MEEVEGRERICLRENEDVRRCDCDLDGGSEGGDAESFPGRTDDVEMRRGKSDMLEIDPFLCDLRMGGSVTVDVLRLVSAIAWW
jgi:hypothetical protein